MRAKELRIGNLVFMMNRSHKIHTPVTGKPLKILNIGLFECQALDYELNPVTQEKWIELSNNDLSPIPLTNEWLLRFGFTEHNHWWRLEDKFIIGEFCGRGCFTYDYYSSVVCTKQIKIKYVHQLQNLYFSLTVTELKLKS